VAGILRDCGRSVEDGVTLSRSNSKTLATQNLCERVGTSDTPGQLGGRAWLGLEPINPTDSLGSFVGRWAHRLAVDVEDRERETEMLGVEMEVAESRVVPRAGGVGWVGPQTVVVGNVGKRRSRSAFAGSAHVGISRGVLFPVTTDLRRRADGSSRASPEIVARQGSRRSISRVDNSRGTGDESGQRRGRAR
jgi:hypothetical protein